MTQQYGYGMNAPLLGQGPSIPQDTQQVKVPPVMQQPAVSKEEYTLPKLTSQSTSMGGGFGGAGSGMGPSGYSF